MKKYLFFTLLIASLSTIIYLEFDNFAHARTMYVNSALVLPKDDDVKKYWNEARDYKEQMRFELARQSYLLALANSKHDGHVQQIKRELQIIDLQIRSLR